MANTLISFVQLLLVAGTTCYSVDERVPSQIDNRRPVSTYLSSVRDDCAPVQFSRSRQCEFLARDFQYYELFEAICQQHQLCYACGSIHSISERKCNTLSRIHMYEQCSKDPWTALDCLQDRFLALLMLADDTYRLSRFAPQCYDNCILDYLYSNPYIE